MKEIWKLIELLNEYHHFNSDLIYYWWDKEYERVYFHTELPKEAKEKLWDALIDDGINEQRIDDERIISKKFWFIKWLVENEKIDFSREWEYSTKSIEEFDWLLRDDSDWLIMLLSIQDEPIEFLISILKNV